MADLRVLNEIRTLLGIGKNCFNCWNLQRCGKKKREPLSQNGLSQNGLSQKGLSQNGLSQKGWRAAGGRVGGASGGRAGGAAGRMWASFLPSGSDVPQADEDQK